MAGRGALSVRWSLDAVARLKDIYLWYAEDYSVMRAKKVVGSIRSRVKQIAKSPKLYPIFPYQKQPNENIRHSIVHGTYWIIYEISEGHIEILDIIHAAQNPDIFKSISDT